MYYYTSTQTNRIRLTVTVASTSCAPYADKEGDNRSGWMRRKKAILALPSAGDREEVQKNSTPVHIGTYYKQSQQEKHMVGGNPPQQKSKVRLQLVSIPSQPAGRS